MFYDFEYLNFSSLFLCVGSGSSCSSSEYSLWVCFFFYFISSNFSLYAKMCPIGTETRLLPVIYELFVSMLIYFWRGFIENVLFLEELSNGFSIFYLLWLSSLGFFLLRRPGILAALSFERASIANLLLTGFFLMTGRSKDSLILMGLMSELRNYDSRSLKLLSILEKKLTSAVFLVLSSWTYCLRLGTFILEILWDLLGFIIAINVLILF